MSSPARPRVIDVKPNSFQKRRTRDAIADENKSLERAFKDVPRMSEDDLRERLGDVVSQIAAIGIQIEEMIETDEASSKKRRFLMDQRNHLYREEKMIVRHLTGPAAKQIEILQKRITQLQRDDRCEGHVQEIKKLNTKIAELNALIASKKLDRRTEDELRQLQQLRASTRRTSHELYEAGRIRGEMNRDRMIGLLRGVAIGDERVIAYVRKSFAAVQKYIEPEFDENGRLKPLPDDPAKNW